MPHYYVSCPRTEGKAGEADKAGQATYLEEVAAVGSM